MKKFCLLLFLLSFCIINAQESQEITASKWKDGEFEFYSPNNNYIPVQWTLTKFKKKLEIKKNTKNKILKISLTGNPSIGDFMHPDSVTTEFVRYYAIKGYEDSKIYFTQNSILVYRIKEVSPKHEIEFEYCIGKKPENNIKDEIINYLESTKKYYVPKSITSSTDIESIQAVVISDQEELSTGAYFQIGMVVKTKWGIELKSLSLNGRLDTKNFTIKPRELEPYKNAWIMNCKKLKNSELEVDVYLTTEPTVKFNSKIPVKCDSENSPVTIQSKVLNEYDFVKHRSYEKGKYIVKKLEKLPETGYTTHALSLMEIFRITNVETNLIQVQKKDKVGYIDKTGKKIIPLEYEDGVVSDFKNKIIAVKKNGKWGFINFQNKVVTKFIYDLVYNESCGASIVKKDDKYGYADSTGREFVNTIYDNVFDFSNKGYGVVVLNGKHGCVDKTGKLIVPIEFEKSPIQLNPDLFAVYKNGKYGVIKTDGNMIFDFKYDEIYPTGYEYRTNEPKENSNVMRVKLLGKYGYIKGDGKVLSECIFTKANDVASVGYAIVELHENKVTKGGDFDIKTGKVHWTSEVKDPEEVVVDYSSNVRSKSKSGPDKKTIKNTGKSILHMGADGSTGYSVNGGGSVEFPCSKKVYYTYYDNGGYNGRGPVISEAKQDCGGTINANGDQYNKK
jgi:hypothetical protein